jgi:predicted O-methyltransferase YrrM
VSGGFDLDAWSAVEEEVRLENERQRGEKLPPERRYRSLHPQSGEFLHLLTLATGARSIVEVGMSAAYSTMWLARACAATGGRVVTLERNDGAVVTARDHLTRAGVADYVEIVVGDARETLGALAGPYDLAFVDGEKDEYVAYVEGVWPLLAAGASLVADNVLSHAEAVVPFLEYLDAVPGASTTVLEIGMGLSWTVKARE